MGPHPHEKRAALLALRYALYWLRFGLQLVVREAGISVIAREDNGSDFPGHFAGSMKVAGWLLLRPASAHQGA